MKILFIGARLFNEVAGYAQSQGIETILSESNPKSPNLKLADENHIVPRGMDKPIELALSKDVDAVVPLIGIDIPLPEVARMKEKLEKDYQLPVVASGIHATEISTDKIKTKDFLIKNNIKTSNFTEISKSQYKESESLLKYPVVLKQPEGQGGVGVKIALNSKDADDYFKLFPNAIAENYIQGAEISVEVLRWKNESIPLVGVYKGDTTLEGTHPLEKIRTAPVHMENLNHEDLRIKAKKIMDLLDANGTAEVEFIFNQQEKEINTLEINTRPSGTRFLTFCSSNINPLHQLVNMAMDEWNPQKIEHEMKSYSSLEMPLNMKNYENNAKILEIKNLYTKGEQFLTPKKPYIIHGPEKASRITIRAENIEFAHKILKNLKIEHYKD
ncbi:MAG: ATP-grasp domain-containing protein [Methanobacterium sp.]|nr:ATP-grasp domain-containing protein [Methanobacterium sp.]